jgi:hypothetical protein
MITLLLLLTGAVTGAPGAHRPCSETESELWKTLTDSVMAMEPEDSYRSVYERATAVVQECPDSERIAYLRLRAAELRAQVLTSNDTQRREQRRLADELAARFPGSVKIATLRARLAGTVEAARSATAIDTSYVPAQVALASALLVAGDAAGADAILHRIKDLRRLDDGFTVLARTRWALGNLAGAVDAANREINGRDMLGVEPGADDVRAIAGAHEILGLALVKKGQTRRAVPHLAAAAPFSRRVQEFLQSADPALRRAVERSKRASDR